MALFRAKQNMMNRGGLGGGTGVQDKMLAFSQEQYAKGQGLPFSSFMDGNPMIVGGPGGMKRPGMDHLDDSETGKKKKKGGAADKKKRKKAKKSTDQPRRALSAYNIFFSEQREQILKEIDAKQKGSSKDEEGDEVKKDDAEKDVKKDDGEDKKEDEDKKDGDEDDDQVPKVLNRTFFPKRQKRAHRKVHGKIGLVDLAREVSKRWKELEPEKKKHYQNLAEEDRKRHKEVMAEYQERKAAENMVSLGSNDSEDEQEDDSPPAPAAKKSKMKMEQQQQLHQSPHGMGMGMPAEQDMRDSMAHQYQQRILAEMMARRPQPEQMAMMNNFGPMNGMGNMQEMNAMFEMQNQRALMLQRMRMSGGMMDGAMGMGPMGPSM
jgi:hypothetical protein